MTAAQRAPRRTLLALAQDIADLQDPPIYPPLAGKLAQRLGERWVFLRPKSHRDLLERVRVAERLLEVEKEDREHTRQWALDAFAEERRVRERLVHVYGVAKAKGASDEELAGPSQSTSAS